MGLFIINGATAGGFSPISVFGSIVNGVVEREDLAENATLLFASSFIFNLLLCVVVFFLFGGRKLLDHHVEPGETVDEPGSAGRFEREVEDRNATTTGPPPIAGGATTTAPAEIPELDRDKILTLIGIVSLVVVALIPLAVPFLETGAVGAVALIIALSISSSVVDSSPFSTSGALTVANPPEEHRERVFERLMQWGMSMVLIAPPIAWLAFVVRGWL